MIDLLGDPVQGWPQRVFLTVPDGKVSGRRVGGVGERACASDSEWEERGECVRVRVSGREESVCE